MKLFLPPKWKVQGGRNVVLGPATPHPSKCERGGAGQGAGTVGGCYQLRLPSDRLQLCDLGHVTTLADCPWP